MWSKRFTIFIIFFFHKEYLSKIYSVSSDYHSRDDRKASLLTSCAVYTKKQSHTQTSSGMLKGTHTGINQQCTQGKYPALNMFCNILFGLKSNTEILNGLKCIDKPWLNILSSEKKESWKPEKHSVCGLHYPHPLTLCWKKPTHPTPEIQSACFIWLFI